MPGLKNVLSKNKVHYAVAKSITAILFKARLFNLTFHKGSHSKGLKQKSTAYTSKENKTFNCKDFCATFYGSTHLFEKYGFDQYEDNTTSDLV